MFLRCPDILAHAVVAAALLIAPAVGAERELRVCADPDNLPYSSQNEAGFENRIARVIANDMAARLSFVWVPLQRGFVRKTIDAGVCDALIGVPAGFEPMLTTRAYYRSAYMFARRSDRSAPLSFDDPVLRTAKIGLPLIGDDGTASPPGYALAALGIINNVSGYPRYGAGPQAQRLIAGIASGELDLAVVWGPQAAYYARMQTAPIVLNYVPPPAGARVPFDYAMAIGVARKNGALRDELDAALARTRPEIDAILQAYQVPRLDAPQDSIGVVSQ